MKASSYSIPIIVINLLGLDLPMSLYQCLWICFYFYFSISLHFNYAVQWLCFSGDSAPQSQEEDTLSEGSSVAAGNVEYLAEDGAAGKVLLLNIREALLMMHNTKMSIYHC